MIILSLALTGIYSIVLGLRSRKYYSTWKVGIKEGRNRGRKGEIIQIRDQRIVAHDLPSGPSPGHHHKPEK